MSYIFVTIVVLAIAYFIYKQYTAKETEVAVESTISEETVIETPSVSSTTVLEKLENESDAVEVEKVKIEERVERLSQIENPDKDKPFAKIGGVPADASSETAAPAAPKKKRRYNRKKKKTSTDSTPSTPASN